MEKSKIDWCDSTWNPVTGCKHGCKYCYARRIAERFGDTKSQSGKNHELEAPKRYMEDNKMRPYPFGFDPTLHRYRLAEYMNKKGRNIFVCSMADLFGEWVPDLWIEEVFNACDRAPQHNYIFLTKNPKRYTDLAEKGILRCRENMWYGFSNTKNNEHGIFCFPRHINFFVSVEPILEPISVPLEDWVIIGAETGNRKGKVVPKREWIEDIVSDCRKYDIPIFMKSSLADIWGEPLIQEFPEQLKK